MLKLKRKTKKLEYLKKLLTLKKCLNPKRHGLFGQLNTWRGRILPFLEKRSVKPNASTCPNPTMMVSK
jgi:hypothetical protein